MAMSAKCIAQVTAAAGKPLTPGKIRAIEDALEGHMVQIARRDRARWMGLSRDQQMAEALQEAVSALQREAQLKEYRATLQALRTAETDGRIADAMAVGNLTRSEGLIRDIEQTSQYIDAVRNDAISTLGDLVDAAETRDGTGLMRNLGMRIFSLDNPAMTADVVREVFGNADGRTGNAAAKAAAQAWIDTTERLRTRFNASGADVGKLGYGYLSQAHDAVKVFEAGPDVWAKAVLPLLDRGQYVHSNGRLLNDAEMLSLLRGAHETISTGGDNKTSPGAFKGAGARANHGSEHRVIHFRDGDAWMAYSDQFGQGSLYDSMIGHVGGMARDIGLVERYGPNPEQQFRVQADIARREDKAGSWANRSAGNTPEGYWNLVSGKAGAAENRLAAQVGQDVRNLQTAAKLGGAVLSALTDAGTIAATLHFNRLPYFDMLRNLGRQFDGGTRDFLREHGVIGESLVSTLNRWTGDNMTHSLTGRVAGSVMKLSLMNAWTDGLRNAFSMTMMGGLARMAKTPWSGLSEWDRYLLQRKGVTEQDWAVVQQAKATQQAGGEYLTPESIRATGVDGAEQVATKVLGLVIDEGQYAVVNPDLATRAITTAGGLPTGTVRGELVRSFAQFKSFPLAVMTRHWRRIFETPQGLEGAPLGFGATTAGGATFNRIAVLAGLNVSMMLLGALVMQNKAVIQGKDPYDMTEGKFWMRALAQGGGMGYLGDLLFKDPTEQRGNSVEQGVGAILGPAAGAAAGLAGDLLVVNAWEAAKGKDTDIWAESLRWANSQTPYQSLWWARGVWERAFLHQAQEALNPGYLSRMQQRAQRDWNQAYWWEPGEILPDRAPSFENVLGD